MIYVLGSINADMVVYSDRFLEAGETLVGSDFLLNQGGKGANQAIAAQKAGGGTEFIGRVGDDYFGEFVLKNLKDAGVSLRVKRDKGTFTGIALINVNGKGENKIIIIHGANGNVGDEEINYLESRIKSTDILMIQGEIDPEVLEKSAKTACEKGTTVIFDPAPVSEELKLVIKYSTFVTPNELEIRSLTGKKVGKVSEGYLADLVLINKKSVSLNPDTNIFANILYSLSSRDIDTVIVNGRVVVRNGKLLTIDLDDVIEEARKSAKHLIVKKDDRPMQTFGK